MYEQDAYPHRVFGLMVVVSAVSGVVFGNATHTAAGLAHQCSRRTVGRWKRWMSELADPEQLQRACTRLQEDGAPGGLAVSGGSRAARVLHLLDRLVELLVARGVQLPALACPVARLLKHQLAGFGDVFYLTKASPPLRADFGGIRF